MKKNLFLTTVLLAGFVAPAFAEDTTTPDKKITGGAGTCTVDVLGVSDNNATANTIATWSLNSYECAAGQYLDETTLNCTECPVGSYCPGGVFTVEANNSKTACPADYTSDAAASAESECYMGCELACGTNAECPPHSNNCTHSEFTTTGKQYVDATCNAYPSVCPVADFQCDTGYSKDFIEFTGNTTPSFELGYHEYISHISYCSPDNISVGATIYDKPACEVLKPGTFVYTYPWNDTPWNVNFSSYVFEVSFNDYDANTAGTKTLEYTSRVDESQVSTETLFYLDNIDLSRGGTGKNIWVRALYRQQITLYGGLISVMQAYGGSADALCTGSQYALMFSSQEFWTENMGVSPDTAQKMSKVIQRIVSGEITTVDAFKQQVNQIKDSTSNEQDKEFLEQFIQVDDEELLELYAILKIPQEIKNATNTEFATFDDNGVNLTLAGQSLMAYCIKLSGRPVAEQMFGLALIDDMSSDHIIADTPWVMPNQDKMKILLDTGNTSESEQQTAMAFASEASWTFLDSLQISKEFCMPNQIKINWNDANGNVTAGSCMYDTGIVLPPTDPVRPGYTFTGWKLVE